MLTFHRINNKVPFPSLNCSTSVKSVTKLSSAGSPIVFIDILDMQIISICYTMPSRDLCKIHEGMFDKPEGVARGFITHSRVFLHRSLEGMV